MFPNDFLRRCFRFVLLILLPCGIGVAQTPLASNAAVRAPGTVVRVELIGDSTQTDNAGYGRGFCADLTAEVDCVNMAKGGASTKTFREQGLWQRSLATKPDYMLIQFGHNDEETPEHLERQTTMARYEQNLRGYVTEARAVGIKPVLITPLTRREFGSDGKVHSDLLAHAATMTRVAREMNVPLIDLQDESIAYLDQIGEAQGTALGITKKDAQGNTIPDKTHLNWKGSYVFGRMVAVDLGKAVPVLAKFVKPVPATLPPEGELAMRVIRGAAFKIVLVGDSTVAVGGGWGPGFCATLTPNVVCVDLAANGRSSKSYIDEGLWAKALAEKGQYYFFQFGHNDQKADPARHTDPDTTYAANLRRFVQETRASGAIPILVTPLSRRNYRDGQLVVDELKNYAQAAKRVAAEEKVTLVDLYGMSTKLLDGMTQEQADALDAQAHPDAAAENGAGAKPDRTHLNERGKALFGRMVADNVIRTEVELGPNVKGVPSTPTLPLPTKAADTLPVVTVSRDGSANVKTLQEAIAQAPASGEVIRIQPGTYREKLQITTPNIHLVGMGRHPQDVVLSWNDAALNAGGTSKSGTLTVDADGFEAENLTIENTWELEHQRAEEGSQAVALLLSSDRAVLDHVRLLGAQDTLYANSRTCRSLTDTTPCEASREYFRDCYIEGHVDYIFGDAKAVFDHCELHSRAHPTVMLTAQSRHFPAEDSGYTFLHCRITGADNGDKVVLGRPWRDDSTVLFYDTDMEQTIAPEGWSDWNGRLRTSTYREYGSHGPGVNGGHRIVSSPPLTRAEKRELTPIALLHGNDNWHPVAEAKALRKLR
jgi:pectin methylesterase-like acyl-CoA thioesterase